MADRGILMSAPMVVAITARPVLANIVQVQEAA